MGELYYSTTELVIQQTFPKLSGAGKVYFRHESHFLNYFYDESAKTLTFKSENLNVLPSIAGCLIIPSKEKKFSKIFEGSIGFSKQCTFDLSQIEFQPNEKVSMIFYCYYILDDDDDADEPLEDLHSNFDLTEKCWRIINFSKLKGTYKSTPIPVDGSTFHFEFTVPEDAQNNDNFTVSFICDSVDGTISLKVLATILNLKRLPTLSCEQTFQISKDSEPVSFVFNQTFADILNPDNGFLLKNQIYLSFRIRNKSYTSISTNNYSTNYSNTNDAVQYADRSKELTGYVGLQNQGATCYMDSMLQCLYHLPAFRRLVYQMPTTGNEDALNSIPLNLQRLFAQMQLGDKACSTKALTRSFRWDDHSTFVQHDTQEFCRVLLDNLEEKMKTTPELQGKVAELFRGQFKSYIRCINVEYESSRVENFYDVVLAIKGCKNIEECFEKYIETEKLDGANQYDTGDGGHGKQDAIMGIEFVELPPVLQLHLGRFEYNYDFDRMFKINDRLEFPLVLDMNRYVKNDKDNTYDLYGVLVHSGNVSFGHYYAFLRPGMKPQWLEFNDTFVSKVEEETAVNNNFGSAQSSSYQQTFSAYILVYIRRQDIDWIFNAVSDEDIPQHLREFIEHPEKFKQAESAQSTEAEIESVKDLTLIVNTEESVSLNCLSGLTGFDNKSVQKELTVKSNETNHSVYEKVSSLFEIPIAEFRLWKCYTYPYAIFSDSSQENLSFISNNTSLFLQYKAPDESLNRPIFEDVIFVKYFDLKLKAPLQYITSWFFNTSDATQKVLFDKMNEIFGLENIEYEIYQENLLSKQITKLNFTTPESTLAQASYVHGSILIFQMINSSDIHLDYPFKDPINQDAQQETDYPVYQYHQPITNIENYFESTEAQLVPILFYEYDDTSKPICKFAVPFVLSIDEFKQFIASKLNIHYDSNQDSLLLYKNTYSNMAPSISPIDTRIYSTIKSIYPIRITTATINDNILFYKLIKGITEDEIFQKQIVQIQLSKDGVNVSNHFSLPLDMMSPYETLIENVKTTIENEQIDFDMNHDPIRVYSINKYTKLEPSKKMELFMKRIRIEYVPEDQKVVAENERLIPFTIVQQAQHNYSMPADRIVLLKLNVLETIKDVKEKIAEVFNIEQEKIGKVKLFAGIEKAHLLPKNVLNDDDKVETIKPGSTIFIVLDIKQFQATTYYRKEEALRIDN